MWLCRICVGDAPALETHPSDLGEGDDGPTGSRGAHLHARVAGGKTSRVSTSWLTTSICVRETEEAGSGTGAWGGDIWGVNFACLH